VNALIGQCYSSSPALDTTLEARRATMNETYHETHPLQSVITQMILLLLVTNQHFTVRVDRLFKSHGTKHWRKVAQFLHATAANC